MQTGARLLRFPTERCADPSLDYVLSLLPADGDIVCGCLRHGLREPDLIGLHEEGVAIGTRMRRQIALPDNESEARVKRSEWFAPLRVRMLVSITRMRDHEWCVRQSNDLCDLRAAFLVRYRTWKTGKRLIAAWETLCLAEEEVRPSASILTFQKKASG